MEIISGGDADGLMTQPYTAKREYAVRKRREKSQKKRTTAQDNSDYFGAAKLSPDVYFADDRYFIDCGNNQPLCVERRTFFAAEQFTRYAIYGGPNQQYVAYVTFRSGRANEANEKMGSTGHSCGGCGGIFCGNVGAPYRAAAQPGGIDHGGRGRLPAAGAGGKRSHCRTAGAGILPYRSFRLPNLPGVPHYPVF